MSKITDKKLSALHNIIKSYGLYKGKTTSKLEQEIDKLCGKIPHEDYNRLEQAFKDYQDYILSILANTKRVFVRIDTDIENVNFDNLENLFEDIEE